MSSSDSGQRPTGSELESRNLTFSQAHGYEELPQTLKLEQLPREARVHICDVFLEFMGSDGYLDGTWLDILWNVHSWYDHRPTDEWDGRDHVLRDDLKARVYQLPFNKVFDFIQFVMRQPECPSEFTISMKNVFARCRLAYTITEDPPPTIVPAVTKMEGEAIVTSLNELTEAGLAGSAAHLRKSAECINRNEWADSIRESIHAVESVARLVTPEKSRTLAEALKSINKVGTLHPALIDAWKKLYAFTSDEQGVRHSLLDSKDSRVGMDEAAFMLGACASFASYLWRKHATGDKS